MNNDREAIRHFLSEHFPFNAWCGWKYVWITNGANGLYIYASKTEVKQDKMGFTSDTERMIGNIECNDIFNETYLFERGELYE